MSNLPNDPGAFQPSPGDLPPEKLAEFQKFIANWAEAKAAGRDAEAESAAMEALMFASEEALTNPSPELRLKDAAAECEARADWAGAEAARREVLALTELSGNGGSISGAQRDLANLFTLLGRDGEALTHARAGTEAARRAGISTLLAMMLRNEVALALRCGEVATALHAADEALQIAEPGRIHDATRGQSLVMHARCLLARGDLEHAQNDLVAARPLLDGHSPSGIAAGAIAAQASWWETNAELLERHERLEEALNAWSEAITRRRHVSQLPQVEGPYTLAALARTRENQAQTLRRAGDSSGANEALAEARALRHQIGLPR